LLRISFTNPTGDPSRNDKHYRNQFIAKVLGEYKNESTGMVEPISALSRLTSAAHTRDNRRVKPPAKNLNGSFVIVLFFLVMDGAFSWPFVPHTNVSYVECPDEKLQTTISSSGPVGPKIGRFTVPPLAKAEMTYKLLVDTIVDYKNATEEELLVFMAYSGALVESSLALTNQEELLEALRNFKDYHAIHIVGMPEDPYVPPTPLDNRTSIGKRTQSAEIVSAGVGRIAGASIAAFDWVTEFSNRCFQDGFPKQTGGSAISLGSGIPYHVELPYFGFDLLPDFLILKVAREGPDKHVETAVMANEAILRNIPNPDHIAALREPLFKLDKPAWVHWHSKVFQQDPTPLLFGSDETPTFFLPSSGPTSVHAINASDTNAIDALQKAVKITEIAGEVAKIHLGPGDLLLINNHDAVHSRYSYSSSL
jgi:hypothetical protein